MFKIRVTDISIQEINLLEIPISAWPDDATRLAKQILSHPTWRKEFMSQLPGMKESWLVQKIEDAQRLEEEFEF